MLFNIESDVGASVVAYLVLDDFSSIPRIQVRGGGEEREIEANEMRDALVMAGRHETGRCGFRIDAQVFPAVAAPDLELREARSGVLIYRRRPATAIERKIVRLETHLLPMWRFDAALAPHFQYAMTRIEQYGRETVTQMLLLNSLSSQYLSGMLHFKNFEYFMDAKFAIWVCAQSPYEELAERLLFLKGVRKVGKPLLSERDQLALAGAMDFAEQLPLDDPRGLRQGLRDMPREVAARLSNPLTRMLTCAGVDDMPTSGAVAAALDVLVHCELVGLRRTGDAFSIAAARLLDLSADFAPPVQPTNPMIGAFARQIEETRLAEPLLEKDLELFYYLSGADAAADSADSADPAGAAADEDA